MGQGALFGHIAPKLSRDVVFVIDGSASMAWEGGQETPQQSAIQWIHEALELLQPGDTAALIDARAQPRMLTSPPTSDFKRIRKELEGLLAPAGGSNLPTALVEALQLLSTTDNVIREVVVLTDGQALPWRIEDLFTWERIDDLRSLPQIPPDIKVHTFDDGAEKTNFSLGRIALSREQTVPGFPIRLRASIRQSGGTVERRDVFLEISGQRIDAETRSVNLLADGEALVEFEQTFPSTGKFLLSVALEADELPVDDRSTAVVVVDTGIPVLLVDGAPHIDETAAETFFLHSAFASSGRDSPWVRAEVTNVDELQPALLNRHRAVFLCNVDELTEPQIRMLAGFVRLGGGLILAPGENTNPNAWNRWTHLDEVPFLPARSDRQEQETQGEPVTIDSASLNLPWLTRFRKEDGVDFWQARFARWWKLEPVFPANDAGNAEPSPDEDEFHGARVIAKLSTGAPLMVLRQFGEGTILQFAAPLDADWSTLPARRDFVPFLHEMVFVLGASNVRRNVDVGAPLILPLNEQQQSDPNLRVTVEGPGAANAPASPVPVEAPAVVRYESTSVPGTYNLRDAARPQLPTEPFVVADDRTESNLTSLSEAEWETLTANDRMQVIEDLDQFTAPLDESQTRTELGWSLLILILILLVTEVALTRKMVKGGHAALEPNAPGKNR